MIMSYYATIMAHALGTDNRVKAYRLGRGWSQAELLDDWEWVC